jgi:hypothetical protein
MITPRNGRREAFESPYRVAHQRSAEARFQLPDHLRELQDAWQAETVTQLHARGLEWEPQEGGSKLGTRRWTVPFRAYVTGNDCDTTEDGEWRWPLRSSLFRLSISRSELDRLAAAFVFLLLRHGFDVRQAWAQQCGILSDPAINEVATVWAADALRRWWREYLQQPLA